MKKILQLLALVMIFCFALPDSGLAQELKLVKPGSAGVAPEYREKENGGEWIKYWEDGVNENSLGLAVETQWVTAIRWMPADLTPYEGWSVNRIPTFMNGDPNRYIFVANDTVFHDTWGVIDMDEDDPDFATVVIGEQEWMAENLKVTHYQNGDPIPDGTGLGFTWPDQDYYFMVDDDPDLVETYGLLYTGYVVKDEREVCPAGWTVPTNAQWQVMEMQLGMSWKVANVWGGGFCLCRPWAG